MAENSHPESSVPSESEPLPLRAARSEVPPTAPTRRPATPWERAIYWIRLVGLMAGVGGVLMLILSENGYPVRGLGGVLGIVGAVVAGILARLWMGAEPVHAEPRPELSTAPPTHISRIDGTREVVETIVFVVVLVLMLKTFVAEAFVIPTGSMATTLWGYQKIGTCPQCGHEFPVNCSEEVEPPRGMEPRRVTSAICPNCHWYLNDEAVVRDPRNGQKRVEARDTYLSSANTGDRVLVAKFLYDLPWKSPERLDVVVFKYPERPQEGYTPMNYIKRLIAFGGETIAIHYGDIYILDASQAPQYEEDRTVPPKDLWQSTYMHHDDTRAREAWEAGRFRILRKPPDKILSMRRIVYDNDHPPTDKLKQPRWGGTEGGPWTEIPASRSFKHAAAADEKTLQWLRYRHLLRSYQERAGLITDFMGYNSGRGVPDKENWVGDLILEAEVTVEKAEGELAFELSRGMDRFRAIWDLSTGVCTLRQLANVPRGDAPADAGKVLETHATAVKAPGTYKIRFSNVDQRLTVWVNRDLPFGEGVVYTASKEEGPAANDLEPASLGIRGAGVTVQHLQLWRDTYYMGDANRADHGKDTSRMDVDTWIDASKFDALRSQGPRTFFVQPGHYLCMGDNSAQSADSRSWGVVPRRLMLGRALAVYYPFTIPYVSPVNRVGPIH